MDAGWAWRIDHEGRINRGYVYSSSFITDEQAEREFRAKNPKVGPTRTVRFITGAYARPWVGNVVAIGNAAGFVEPLEATSLGAICIASQNLAEMLAEAHATHCAVPPTLVRLYNQRVSNDWSSVRDFLAVHYRFNTRLDTPFWRECRQSVDLGAAQAVVECFREDGPTTIWRDVIANRHDQFGPEGYLSMLVGQSVPYQCKYTPPPREMDAWRAIRRAVANKSAAALTTEGALARVRAPGWRPPAKLYG
jgi:tryptophan 7-halogenase